MKLLLAFLALVPATTLAQDSPYVATQQTLAPFETTSRAVSVDRKRLRVTTTYHNPYVVTWARKDGAALTAADAALFANRLPACPVRCARVDDGKPGTRSICLPAPYQSIDVSQSRYAVTINFDCYAIGGYITGG